MLKLLARRVTLWPLCRLLSLFFMKDLLKSVFCSHTTHKVDTIRHESTDSVKNKQRFVLCRIFVCRSRLITGKKENWEQNKVKTNKINLESWFVLPASMRIHPVCVVVVPTHIAGSTQFPFSWVITILIVLFPHCGFRFDLIVISSVCSTIPSKSATYTWYLNNTRSLSSVVVSTLGFLSQASCLRIHLQGWK